MEYIVRSTDPSKELFVGYARASDAGPYLGQGIMYETPIDWHWEAEQYYASIEIPSTNITNIAAPPRPPQEETFWLTSAHSNCTAKIYYLPLDDMYTLFIMNQDGSKNVQAELQIGFKVQIFTWLPYLLIPLGLILLLGGAYLILRNRKRE